MKYTWIILTALLLAAVVGLMTRLGALPPAGTDRPAAPTSRPASDARIEALHIGLVPERDVFLQRRGYQALGGYLAHHLGRPVELVTMRSYATVLEDFQNRQIDAAFLGSLVAVLAIDRLDARVLVKTEQPGGISTYRAAIFVPDESPIHTIDDLVGHSLAAVRTTTGGNLYPLAQIVERGLIHRPDAPRLVWVGTHDDAISAVMDGLIDAGAVKDLRLMDYQKRHPEKKIRCIAASQAVPNNALVLRGDLAQKLGPRLREILLNMDQDPLARESLERFGAARFVPCEVQEFAPIYDLIEPLGDNWREMMIEGPPPRRARAPAQAQPR